MVQRSLRKFMLGSRHLAQFGAACILRVPYNYCQYAMASLLVPPSSLQSRKKVDYEAFNVTLQKVPCLMLPSKETDQIVNQLKKYLLKLPKFRPVQTDKKTQQIVIHLDPREISNITPTLKETIRWSELFCEKDLELSYENWTREEILRAILPKEIEVPTSYSIIGHIVHLNLRDEQLPYKNVIGQVLLDKIPSAKTVVNKLNEIDNTYRYFAMEILVGEPNTVVRVKESNCTFEFDFSKVYWNPRLATEHEAIVKLLKAGDVLYDVFAGVGPFSIPAARKKVCVLANDLNPESYKWLVNNAKLNKVTKNLTAFNKDGREFLMNDVKKNILKLRHDANMGQEHITMNLPALAVEFLDVFTKNWLSIDEINKIKAKPPIVHVYCFIKAAKTDDFKAMAKQLIEHNLGVEVPKKALINIHHVRNVAPCKEMMRVSFLLVEEILKGQNIDNMEEPAKKKTKFENTNTVDCHDVLGINNGKEGTERKPEKEQRKQECIQSYGKEIEKGQSSLDLGQGSKLNSEKTNMINKQLKELSKEVYRSKANIKKSGTVTPLIAKSKFTNDNSGTKEQVLKMLDSMQL
uniref:tRNA (guanine(37)-N1)-methyltransferase n=1 Tax=Trichogramma kaykai TaxID=54128 RepID=A0ABD2XES9_9HYME